MLALLLTWQNGDVSMVRDGGNFEKCMQNIKAKALVMPSKTDLYFCVRLNFECLSCPVTHQSMP